MKRTPEQVIKQFEKLKGDRGIWEEHWQEITDFIIPRKNNITTKHSPGEKKGVDLLDNTAMQSNELLAGALHGLLTNPNSQWFDFTTGDDDLDNNDNVRGWLQKQSKKILNVMNNSNFQTEVHEVYLDLCSIGTAPMSIEEDEEMVVRFASRFISEVFVKENNKGIIDELFRCFSWTASQIVDEWGVDVLATSNKLKESFDKMDKKEFEILHVIYKEQLAKGEKEPKFKYTSQYVLIIDKVDLNLKGFRLFPYVVPRWTKVSGETYGRSPGMNALPEAKTINKMTETTLKGAQKVVDPPLQVPDDGFLGGVITKPAGINYYRAGSSDRIVPILNDARIDFGFQAMNDRRQRIREAYYTDKLALQQQGPQMTATEVLQRTEETMRLLGPMLGRQQTEFLKPLIERVYDIMERRGMIDPPPIELKKKGGTQVTPQYSSLIARAQRASDAQNIQRTVQAIAPFAQFDQTVLDNIKVDGIWSVVKNIYDFPEQGVHSQKEIKAIRDARAQAHAEAIKRQQTADQVANASKIAPALAQVQDAGGDLGAATGGPNGGQTGQ